MNPGFQRTLAAAFTVEGMGLHEGKPCVVRVLPAPEHTGFVFVRTDLPGCPQVAATPLNVRERARRTLLCDGAAEVHTVEHVLAGLFGAGVDNARIELDGPEPPAGDGSANVYTQALIRVGMLEQGAERRVFSPPQVLHIDEGNASLELAPHAQSLIEYQLDYGDAAIASATVTFAADEAVFVREISGARTFCLEREAEALRRAGFGKGANTQNTLVMGVNGPMDNQLRWADEPARHKVLDVIGDLALAGCRVRGKIVARRSGHSLNQRLARMVYERMH